MVVGCLTASLRDQFQNVVSRVKFHFVTTVKDSFHGKLRMCALVIIIKAVSGERADPFRVLNNKFDTTNNKSI